MAYRNLKLDQSKLNNNRFIYPGKKILIKNYILQNNIRTKIEFNNNIQVKKTKINSIYDNIDIQLDNLGIGNFSNIINTDFGLFAHNWSKSDTFNIESFLKTDGYKNKQFTLSNYEITNKIYNFNVMSIDILTNKGKKIEYIHFLELFPYNNDSNYDFNDNDDSTYENNPYPIIKNNIEITENIKPFFVKNSNTDISNIKNDNYSGISIYYNHILLKDMINPNLSYDIYNNTHIFGIGGKYHFSKNDFFIDDKNGIIGIYKLNDKLAKTIFGCNEYYAKIYNYNIINNNIILNENTKVPPINFSFFRKKFYEFEDLIEVIDVKPINEDYFDLFKIDITDNENKKPINIIDNHIYNTYIYYNYHDNNLTVISNNQINDINKKKLLYTITNNYNLLDTNFHNKTLYFHNTYVEINKIQIVEFFDDVILYLQGNHVNTYTGFFFFNENDLLNNLINNFDSIGFTTIYNNNIPDTYNFVKWVSVIRNIDSEREYQVELDGPLYMSENKLTKFNIYTKLNGSINQNLICKGGFFNIKPININNYIIIDISSRIIPEKNSYYINNLKELYMGKKFEIYYDKNCNELKYSFDINDLNIKLNDITLNVDNTIEINSEYRNNDISCGISGWIKNDISINTYIIKNENPFDVSINYICDYSGIIIGSKKDIDKYTIFNGMLFNTIDKNDIKINNLDYYEEKYKMYIFTNEHSAKKYINYKKNNLNKRGVEGDDFLHSNQQIFINTNDMSLNDMSLNNIYYDSDLVFINDISTPILETSGQELNLQKYDISFYYLDSGNYKYVENNLNISLTINNKIKIQYNDNYIIFKNSGYIHTNLTESEYIDNYNIENYIVFYDGYEYYYRKNNISNISKEVLINEDLHLYINKKTKFEFFRDNINLGYINAIN